MRDLIRLDDTPTRQANRALNEREVLARREVLASLPRVLFVELTRNCNLGDVAAIFALAARYGVEHVMLYDAHPPVPAEEAFTLDDGDRAVLAAQRAAIAATGVRCSDNLSFRPADGSLPTFADGHRRSTTECRAPWRMAFVQANGEVVPCCDLHRVMGDLKRQSFAEVWNRERYVALRRSFVDGKPLPECAACQSELRG